MNSGSGVLIQQREKDQQLIHHFPNNLKNTLKISTENLAAAVTIGIDIIITIVFVSENNFSTSTFSVSAENTTKPIPQSYVTIPNISSCSQTREINETYKQCVISVSNTTGIGNLPSPFLKFYPSSGCCPSSTPGGYVLVKPQSNLLSQDQVERVIKVIRNDTQIKFEPFAWKVTEMGFYPMNYSWYDFVRLEIHGIKQCNSSDCGWYASVTVDLNTLTITNREDTSVTSYQKC